MAYDQEQVASYYVSLFPARSDVYSAWTPAGWRPVREPLTPDIVLAGLTGSGPSISGYMIAPGSTSHSLAVDFDTDNGFDQAMALGKIMFANGMPAYVETSRRGAHLWCVLDAVLPAIAIRSAIRALLGEAGLPTGDPHIELRPGSDHVADDGLGHAIRLPYMPHPKTGQRGTLLHPGNGSPLGHTLAEVILNLDWAPAGVLHPGWSERWRPKITVLPAKYRKAVDFPEDDTKASDILREMWGVMNARPGISVRCPAHDDRIASLSILRDDRRAICKAGHCILNNEDRGRGTYELRTLAPVPAHG